MRLNYPEPNMRYRIVISTILIAICTHAQQHKYDEWHENYTVQALLGAVRYDDLKITDDSGAGDPKEIDHSSLPQIGGAWTTLPIGNRIQCGLEAIFLLGFRFDKVNYISLSGGVAEVSISTSMWTFDLGGGAYVNIFPDPKRRIRIYGGAGPLLLYGNNLRQR
jgi:hypothetical protein